MKYSYMVTAFLCMFLSSCMKKYTCVCEITTTSGSQTTSETSIVYMSTTSKRNAKLACESMSDPGGPTTYRCSLR